ncbi:metal-dependent hydrolase [Candidatus Halobonum tyrrellensis]|uniref:metal-dependent hydrolase n=1 Tax=Candidatus Halobonum tyrrellensis TaxID=1431545 RepID=UPI000677D271|nr:metal-dependent hydrolase [Candidatus Halobonum tyrrellensis]
MYRTGHLGVSLLAFAPVGYWLVSAGFVALAFVTAATMCYLAMLPDVDHRLPGIPHRGPTHSLAFAALVGGAFALVAGGLSRVLSVATPAGLSMAAFGFLVGFGSVFAHLLGDVVTPMGVRFLWPSSRSWSLRLTTADSRVWNGGLFALGVFAVAASTYLAL